MIARTIQTDRADSIAPVQRYPNINVKTDFIFSRRDSNDYIAIETVSAYIIT